MTDKPVSSSMPFIFFAAGVGAIVLATFWLLSSEPEQQIPVRNEVPVTPMPVTPEPETEVTEAEISDIIPEQEPEPVIETVEEIKPEPALINESDEPFVANLAQLGPAHPVKDWLQPNQVLRKTVALVDALSRGEMMYKNRPITMASIDGPFLVELHADKIELSANNFARYDMLISAIEYVDEDSAVALYRFWSPRLEEAYGELGMSGGFDDSLKDALQQIIDAPIVEGKIELIRPSVYYKFADPQLENLSDVEKFIIRIGPANAERLKAKTAAFLNALEQ